MHELPNIQQYVSLKPYNTFAIAVTARYLCDVYTISQLQSLLTHLTTHPTYSELPFFVLGGGSNILLTRDFPGVVIRICIAGIDIIKETTDAIWVESGAGENWQQLVNWSLQHHYGGIENLSLIPGSVGAAPVQNIGAYGVELADCFSHLTAVSIKDGALRTFNLTDCDFAYRHSIFKSTLKNHYIICRVCLKLTKQPKINIEYAALKTYLADKGIHSPSIHDVSQAVTAIRQQKLPDPITLANAGSFFKNPLIAIEKLKQLQSHHHTVPYFPVDDTQVKVPAAWLIEQCGWRGKRFGDVGIYPKQAVVLVNYGGGTGYTLDNLAKTIAKSVYDQFEITLQPEVCII